MLSSSEASKLLTHSPRKDSSANDSHDAVSPRREEKRESHPLGANSGLSCFLRAPLAAPCWSRATYQEIFRAILSGRVADGAAVENLRSLISQTLKVDNVFLCGSGSLALELALRAVRLRSGDEVVIPAFCCSAVVPPIIAAGGTPVLADVGEELNLTVETVSAVLTRKTRAIIVPHLFGNPVDILPIIDLAHSKNIRVVDDAAQALGAAIDGQLVGSFGDAGILSFGREKVCFGVGGGALICQDEAVADLPRAKSLRPLGELLSVLINYCWRRWSAPLSKILTSSTDPGAPPQPYSQESMSNLSAAVAATLIEALSENIAARRARVRAYRECLGNEDRLTLIPHRPGSACLTQVVRILSKNRARDTAADTIKVLAAQGYEIHGSYIPIHLLGRFSSCVWDRLSYSERVWADLIELPCGPSVSPEDVARIAAIVAAGVND